MINREKVIVWQNKVKKISCLAFFGAAVSLAGCGGGGGGGGSSSNATPTATPAATPTATPTATPSVDSLSGTAAAGAAIIGTVTVKGALGNTVSSIIEANGTYTVDVSSLTAPYRLRAQGSVGGKTYKLHSYAETADLGGTVNITPFTDLIIANTALQIAEAFFDSETTVGLDPAEIAAQETALQSKLQNVFDALGLDTAINLLNSSFSADHSGLDAALDIVQISATSDNIVTITNLLDGSQITDDITDALDNTSALAVDAAAVGVAVSDTQAIINLFNELATAFAAGLPTQASIENIFAANFLEEDASRGEFLTDITTDPSVIGLHFRGVSVSQLNSIAGTAIVQFRASIANEIETEVNKWFVQKDDTLGWQLLGDQQIADVEEITFHCNDYNGSDNMTGGCGINTRVFDEDFSNNGTNNAPIASARVTIIDGGDGVTIKDTFYLGNPEFAAPGDIQVYNESDGSFQGDYRGFGSGIGEIESSIFEAGDIVQYDLYTDALDISSTSNPAVSVGSEVATYTSSIIYPPSLVGLYPTATSETIAAINGFSLGENLTISWTLAAGTVSDDVLVQVSDTNGNRIEIWDDAISSSATTATFNTSSFDDAFLDNPDFDPTSNTYTLLVRIYAADEVTGQAHSTDYRANSEAVDLPSFSCNYQSGWNDLADDGLGAPINPNSFADFEAVVADCGGGLTFDAQEVAGSVFLNDGETTSFINTGSGTEADPATGEISASGEDPAISFQWYVESASNQSYLVMYSNNTIDSDIPAGVSFRETAALISVSGTRGQAGAGYSYIKYSEQSNFGDMVRDSGDDGEIWNSIDVLQ